MKLSILIVNWNSKDYLRKCLMSIRATCTDGTPQIIVVDGGSYDGCAEMLALEYPEVEFIQSPENIGFGGSNNLGFGKVTGEALLLLNPDTELRPGAVQVLMESLQQLPNAGLIGARLLNSDGSLQLTSVHRLPTVWNVVVDSEWVRRRWWRQHAREPSAKVLEVEGVSGACMMLHAATFRRLGGFDPRYFMYAEDMDLCFKVRRSGLKIYHAPQALVLHHGGGCTHTQLSNFSVVMIREAIHVYLRCNCGRLQSSMYRILMGISAGLRMLVLVVRWLPATEEIRLAIWGSISKWWTVLRWCLGLETWARDLYCGSDSLRSATDVAQGKAQVAG